MLLLILMTYFLGMTHAVPPCSMRPMLKEITASRTPGDGGYEILFSEQSNEYIPHAIYTISLQGSATPDGLKLFKRFTLTMHSQDSPIIHIPIGHFQLRPEFYNTTTFNDKCIRTVSESTDYEKFDIKVNWRAPMQGTGCVIFSAMVLENNERWYAEDGALTKIVCEAEIVNAKETRKLEVVENTENESKRSSHVKLIQKRNIALPDDPVHLAKIKTVCMPKPSRGRCMGYYRRWAFNSQRLKCQPFWYGGCHGNHNNFLTAEICDNVCDIVRTTLIRQALNVTVNRDQTPTDSLSPSSPYSPSGLRRIPLVKLDNV